MIQSAADLRVALDTDLMFYFAAVRALVKAAEVKPNERPFVWMQKELEALQERIAKGESVSGEMTNLGTRAIVVGFEFMREYSECFEHFSVVHTMAAAALEAHINAVGLRELKSNRMYDEFDRMSLSAKWLFLPKMLGHAGFDRGAEPFQSFDMLVGWRNALMHFKPKSVSWTAENWKEEVAKIGLTIEQAERSVKAVPAMVLQLGKQMGADIEAWEDDVDSYYFRIDYPDEIITEVSREMLRFYNEKREMGTF